MRTVHVQQLGPLVHGVDWRSQVNASAYVFWARGGSTSAVYEDWAVCTVLYGSVAQRIKLKQDGWWMNLTTSPKSSKARK